MGGVINTIDLTWFWILLLITYLLCDPEQMTSPYQVLVSIS